MSQGQGRVYDRSSGSVHSPHLAIFQIVFENTDPEHIYSQG